MTPAEYDYLRKVLKERSGLNLADDKGELLEGRLRPLLKEFSLPSTSALAIAAMRPDAEYLRARAAQAATVQESYFFRNKATFAYFTDIALPKLIKARGASRRIRIWCAAAATGQEPYSLAMLIADQARELEGWSVEILATDYAKDALHKARKGIYSQFEVQRGLPVSLLIKYFVKAGKGWEISPNMRGMVEFREHNLIADACEPGLFDVIFCRNVLIYFDDATKRKVLMTLEQALATDGTLVLGAAETTTGLSRDFASVGEPYHGIFTLSPEAIARRVAESACKSQLNAEVYATARRIAAR